MLEFQHVSVACQRTPLLEDISVSFPTGQITTIVGPNGCGKTTLLQCLNGSSRVTGGRILLDGEDYLALPARERAKRLSFLPQVRAVIPTLPVRTLVEHGRFPYLGFSRKKSAADVEIVRRAMEFCEVSDYADQYADTLSGGVRQRVFLAMQLAQDSPCLVLDEPTTYLDLKGQRTFLTLLERLRREQRTIILVLHDLNQALAISDHFVVMQERRIVACATPAECVANHVLEEVFEANCKTFRDEKGAYYFFQ